MHFKCNLSGCRNIPKFCGYNQSMEVVTTSKETMLLYDSCIILFWSGCSHHHSSILDRINTLFFPRWNEWNTRDHKGVHILYFICLFVVCAFYAECWTIPSPNLSIFPSRNHHKREGMKILNAFRRRVTNWIAIDNLSGYCIENSLSNWFFEGKNRFTGFTAFA